MPEEILLKYDRNRALEYSKQWVLSRNPRYYDYSNIGGDCTNFNSQCIYAGSGVMNYTKTYGWYYNNANDKAPAWTSVPYLYNFLTRNSKGPGPVGKEAGVAEVEVGDIVQLAFQDSGNFSHSLFIVQCANPAAINNILINTHTNDREDYPLKNYFWSKIRFIKILGVRR